VGAEVTTSFPSELTHQWTCDVEGCNGRQSRHRRKISLAERQPHPVLQGVPEGWIEIDGRHLCPRHEVRLVISDAERLVDVHVEGDPLASVYLIPVWGRPEREQFGTMLIGTPIDPETAATPRRQRSGYVEGARLGVGMGEGPLPPS
jgi:hypothetical protein